jgi:hypothetical protein
VPALLIIVLGITSSFFPAAANPLDPDPDLGITIPLTFALILAVGTFLVASIFAITGHIVRESWRKRELRRIGERFGWNPQTDDVRQPDTCELRTQNKFSVAPSPVCATFRTP